MDLLHLWLKVITLILWLVLHSWSIFITFMVFITFMGDTYGDWMMNGEKYLTAARIDSALTSHGSQVT